MEPVVLDSDVASLTFRRRLAPTLAARLVGRLLCVSFVTVGEMTVWAEVRRWGPSNRAALDDWLDSLVRLPYDDEVARTWGRLQRCDADGPGRSTTPGSPPAASYMAFLWPPGT